MTFEERLSELGVETRDFVPSDEHCKRLYDKFYADAKRICKTMSVELDGAFMVSLLLVAVAKRDIIIDRLETRIVNLTGDVDYLKEIYEKLAEEYGYSEEYDGVPEDWSVDNA